MAAALTPRQVYSLVSTAGFADPVTATAVVIGESGGDPAATNTNTDGSKDRGIWQINSKAHPQVSEAQARSIAWSTSYALALSKGGKDWGPWSVTRSPRFPDLLSQARAAKNDDKLVARDIPEAGGPGGILPPGRTGAGQVADIASDAAGAVVGAFGLDDLYRFGAKALGVVTSADFWKRAGLVVLGVGALVLGLVVLFGKTAVSLTPQGAAVTAATGGAALN